jgi:hypothetical protein
MPYSEATPAQLLALPDDILRAMAAFMPPSGLLAMARCSWRLSTVLRGEVSRCLDGLFIVGNPSVDRVAYAYRARRSLGSVSTSGFMSRRFLASLFGEEAFRPSDWKSLRLCITEAPKGYDGPCRNLQTYQRSPMYTLKVCGPSRFVLVRFSNWLKFRFANMR